MQAEDNAARGRAECAVIWDFDWSFINENSDTYVIEMLVPCLIPELKDLMKTTFKNRWTALMDHMVGRMMVDYGITVSQLNDCLCSIPMFAENVGALKLAHSSGAMNFILSDANHHYISVILDHHKISSLFVEVESNASSFEVQVAEDSRGGGGATSPQLTRLRISAHQAPDAPHTCTRCPVNLCKGQVLRRWLGHYSFERVVYVGDGSGDFCPVLCLRAADVALCRHGFPLHKLVLAEAKSESRLAARVMTWSSGGDILASFREIFQGPL